MVAAIKTGTVITAKANPITSILELITGKDATEFNRKLPPIERGLAGASVFFLFKPGLGILRGLARGRKIVVIGETMVDVRASAQYYGAKYWASWDKWRSEEEWFRLNVRWIRDKIKDGYEFIDIGLDARKAARSRFYAEE